MFVVHPHMEKVFFFFFFKLEKETCYMGLLTYALKVFINKLF